MRRFALLGPPGTGKTTAGMHLVETWGAGGVGPEDVAYLAFTRAAADEAASRAGGDRETHPFFRTIHSLCFWLLRQVRGDFKLVATSSMKQFAAETGMEGAYGVHGWEDVAETLMTLENRGQTEWDLCRSMYSISRLSARSIAELDAARESPSCFALARMGYVWTEQYRAFVRKYEEFKAKNGLIDFTDMLEWPVRNGGAVPCRKVVVDEAQDLCPLHYAILDRLFEDAEEMWLIGDDDQSIFSWAGASSSEFLSRIRPIPKVVLRQTHRFGDGIVRFSERVILRVGDRVAKDVIGKPGHEGLPIVTGAFQPSPDPGLILHRHVEGCQRIARLFIDAGIPFRNERGRDPLSSPNRVRAFLALHALAAGERAPTGRVFTMVDELLPSIWINGDQKVRLVVHGGKKKLSEMGGIEAVSLDDLVNGKILTEDGAKAVRARDFAVMKHADDLAFYGHVLANGYDLGAHGPTITTIHGSKGRQAPHVTVFSEMSARCWDNADEEHRLAYVAATRTQGDVTICAAKLVDWAGTSYGYPMGDE